MKRLLRHLRIASDHHLEATIPLFNTKEGPRLSGYPCRNLLTPLTTWLTMPTLKYPNMLSSKKATHASDDSRIEQSITWQLLLGSKRMVNEALRQTLEKEVVKLPDVSPVRLLKTSKKMMWRSQTPIPTE
jgi:hypothetical protein